MQQMHYTILFNNKWMARGGGTALRSEVGMRYAARFDYELRTVQVMKVSSQFQGFYTALYWLQ